MTACQRMNAEHREIGVGSQRTLARHECPLVVAMQHARLGTQAVVHDVVVIGEQAHKQEHRRHDHQIMPPRRHQERCSERLPVELLPLADEHHDNNKQHQQQRSRPQPMTEIEGAVVVNVNARQHRECKQRREVRQRMAVPQKLRGSEHGEMNDKERYRDEHSANGTVVVRLPTRQQMLCGREHIGLIEIEVAECEA